MKLFEILTSFTAGLCLASAIQLDVNNPASIKTASADIVFDMLKTWYTGNTSSNPTDYGTLPRPYYWWEAGAMFGGLVNYAHYTGDKSYDETIAKAITSQASDTVDFMMLQRSAELGNDDILFWALTAMNAAEYDFYVPSTSPQDIYFQLSRNVFNLMVSRWNTTTCNGGLKWQWIPQNNGFYYKSTITNSAFFQLAARLGRMTGNQTYLDWANKAYDWMIATKYIDSDHHVYDGAGDAGTDDCKILDKHEWSYNIASTIAGAAYMYNATESSMWQNRTEGLLNTVQVRFVQPFPNATNTLYERECENAVCSTDQLSFKAYLAQSLGKTAVMHPAVSAPILTILQTSALGAAKTCAGGSTGRLCGTKWYINGWDGSQGVGQQMTAFQVISSLLVGSVGGPVKRADRIGSPASSAQPTYSSPTSTSTLAPTSTLSSTSTLTSVATSISPIATKPSSGVENVSKPAKEENKGHEGFLAKPGALVSDCLCVKAKQ